MMLGKLNDFQMVNQIMNNIKIESCCH